MNTTDLIKSAEAQLDLVEKLAAVRSAELDEFIAGAEAFCKQAQLDTESIAKMWALLGSEFEKYAAAPAFDATSVATEPQVSTQAQMPEANVGGTPQFRPKFEDSTAVQKLILPQSTQAQAPQPWYKQMLNNWKTNPSGEFGKLLPGMLIGGLGGALYNGLRGGDEKNRPGFIRSVLLPALLGGGLSYAGIAAAPHIKNMWNQRFGAKV